MPRRINLTIDGLRKKQAPKPVEPDPDVVWPTMLEDDAPSISQFVFKCFRGDTEWDAEEEEWKTIPAWAEVSEKGVYHWSETATRPHNNTVEDIDFKYIGNNFVLTTEQVQAEYGAEAEDKFNRMPLQIVTEREEDDKRWTMFANGMNARFRLLKENDTTKPKFDVSPDLMEDKEQKGSWKFVNQTDIAKPDEYRLRNLIIPAKYGLEVKEIGTKSICHYIQHVETDPLLSYGVDWLDPEGIFICPFNTLDTDNYKITREPDYAADAVDGHILFAMGITNVEIYFMFRRWAYYCRIAHIQTDHYEGGDEELIYVETCGFSDEPGLCGSCAGLSCEDPFQYDECERYRESCGRDPEDDVWVHVDCARSCSDTALYKDEQLMCHDWSSTSTCSWVDGGCHQTSYETSDSDPYECEDPAWSLHSASVSNTYTQTITGGWRYYGNSYIGLWWGAPPVGFFLPSLSEKTREASFIYKDGEELTGVLVNLVGDESHDEAVQHFTDAGGDEQLTGEILGGYNSLHYFAPIRWTRLLVENPLLDTDIRDVLNRFCSTADGKLLKIETEGIRRYKGTDNQLAVLWTHILESDFFTTYWPMGMSGGVPNPIYAQVESGYCTRNAFRDVPYGVGLSPMKEGTLCAIIKVRNKPYYVWRKTDEDFTERYLSVSGIPPETKPFVSFEGSEDGRALDFYIHFSGEGRKNTHILATKEAVCQTYAHYGLEDPSPDYPIEDCEKIIPFIERGAGQVELESPVYPIISRWKASDYGSAYQDQLMRYFPSPHWYGYTFSVANRDRY